MRIVYIGNKDAKSDNIAATGLVWKRGQIHEVEDEAKYSKLLEHPLIWKNADEQYELIPELKAVAAMPVAKFVATDDPFIDSFIQQVPDEILKALHARTLVPVFMSAEDVAEYGEWKLEKDTRPDPAPRETGPAPQEKETRPGLEGIDRRTREYKQLVAAGKAA